MYQILNGWNDWRHRSSGTGNISPNKSLFFAQKELQDTLDKMIQDNFNKLPYHVQMQIKLEKIRKNLKAIELFNNKLNPKDFII